MPKKELSPEEKLLGVIKKKKKPEILPVPESVPDKKVSAILKSGIFRAKIFSPASLKKTNRYLAVILGVLLLYFIIDLIFTRPYKDARAIAAKAEAGQAGKILSGPADKVVPVKDYSSYSSAASPRTVFGQAGESASEDVMTSGDMSERIGLVGIIAGDNPQAIIEDKKAQKTYYLNKGQSFDGYMVEDIQQDKVILDYGGKKISLFL